MSYLDPNNQNPNIPQGATSQQNPGGYQMPEDYRPPTGYPYPGAAQAGNNALAIASFVVSIISILFFPLAIVSVIFGHISLGQIKRKNEGGRGLALAGVIISWVIIGTFTLYIVFMVSIFAITGIH